jgi:hypothetical protein
MLAAAVVVAALAYGCGGQLASGPSTTYILWRSERFNLDTFWSCSRCVWVADRRTSRPPQRSKCNAALSLFATLGQELEVEVALV